MDNRWQEIRRLFLRIPLVLRYGVLLAAGLILLKTLEYQLFSYRLNLELYTGLIAGFFMLLGLATSIGWFHMRNKRSAKNKQIPLEFEPLTVRERDLLIGLDKGLTNQQLAEAHFLSVNTIKTHLKSVYRKLEVSNRSEAVATAKKHSLI